MRRAFLSVLHIRVVQLITPTAQRVRSFPDVSRLPMRRGVSLLALQPIDMLPNAWFPFHGLIAVAMVGMVNPAQGRAFSLSYMLDRLEVVASHF